MKSDRNGSPAQWVREFMGIDLARNSHLERIKEKLVTEYIDETDGFDEINGFPEGAPLSGPRAGECIRYARRAWQRMLNNPAARDIREQEFKAKLVELETRRDRERRYRRGC